MISFEAGAIGIGLALLLSHRHEAVGRHGGLLLALAGGLLIGVCDVAIKALADTVPAAPSASSARGPRSPRSPGSAPSTRLRVRSSSEARST